jgi:hypothetical protein
MWHKWAALGLAMLMAGSLSGCLFSGADELYALPQLSDEYLNLQDVLSGLVSSGLEYAAPKSGSNTQAIQFVDLNGDNTDEVVAFFREEGATHPLKVYIFQRTEDGPYGISYVLEGDGTAFHSAAYVDLGGSDNLELLVDCQISDQVYTLNVYDLEGQEASRLLQAGCSRYAVGDLDQDGTSELVLLQLDGTEEGGSLAEWYRYTQAGLEEQGTVALSDGIVSLKRVRSSLLVDDVPAIYVTSVYGEQEDQLITDILALRQGKLENLTLDEEMGYSTSSLRANTDTDIFATDLNGDGIYEIPFATELTELGDGGVWTVDWLQYHLDGTPTRVCTTLCSPEDGWYLLVGDDLRGNLGALRTESSQRDEAAVTVYDLSNWEEGEELPPSLFTISVLTGANRVSHSQQQGRFLLSKGSETIYTGQVEVNGWGITQDTITQSFQFMPTNWSNLD